MMTKAELEAEIERLKLYVAHLEGEIAAYKHAIESVNKPQPETRPFDTWPTYTLPYTPAPLTITS